MALVATKERCVICLGYGYWGSGKTEEEAVRNWRAENGTLDPEDRGQREVEVVIIDAPASFSVGEVSGSILRHKDSPPSKELKRLMLKV